MIRKKIILFVLPLLVVLGFAACSGSKETPSVAPASQESPKGSMGDIVYNSDRSIALHKLEDGFWVFVTSKLVDGYVVPANGLLAVSSEGLILIDTPWDDEKTNDLIRLAEGTFGKRIVLAVITHAHADRIGGIHALLEHKIKAVSTGLTADLAQKGGYDRPLAEIKNDVEPLRVGDVEMEVFYPGEGHSRDNITVWFLKSKLLYGGCLIKSLDSKNLGSIEEANVKQWPVSLETLLKRYPDVQTVIPGHGDWGGKELIGHTLKILKADPAI